MIGRLTGRIVAEDADGSVVIDVGGVGYEVVVPLGALGRALRTGEGDAIVLHVHTHVREDAFELFGFASELDRALFRLLLSVQKVGPKLAMGVLSALPRQDFARAVRAGDVVRLSKVPGIGRKTAERLVLELKDKVAELEGPASAAPLPAPLGGTDNLDRLLAALVNMGYRSAEAERALRSLGDRVAADPMPDLLRDALAALRRGA